MCGLMGEQVPLLTPPDGVGAARGRGWRHPGACTGPALQSPAVWLSLQGACPAGGCMIALSCDCRVLADNPKSHIGLNETLLGITAPFW